MDKKIDALRKTRASLLSVIEGLTIEQLNEIPEGFNNNIIWNLGHLLAAQQNICYFKGGVKITIDEQYISNYSAGTKPDGFVESITVDEIKALFSAVIGQFEIDYQNNVFAGYTPWTNRYGIALNSIEDAMTFVLFHEGVHLGSIMALKRVLKK